jgi:3-hydroxyacyl-CoA dehydrogenase/enoyl-CoA hydratase/3-hydroxybutyryl-CoA epimerase
MLNGLRHFSLSRDDRGVVTVTLDVHGFPVNILSEEVVRELAQIVDDLEQSAPRAVVFRSGKLSGFLAGADLRYIQQIETPVEATTALETGTALLDRIWHLPCPTMAVIHGLCLGGGLEFALGCRYRVARDDPSTRLGLPETQLGLIPGWGGTQRLPRLVGLRSALRMILEGSKLSAKEAFKIGLVDLAPAPEEFEARVEKFIADRLVGKPAHRPRGSMGALLDKLWLGRWLVFRTVRRRLAGKAKQYPALTAALSAIQAGLRRPAAGVLAEKTAFVHLLFTDTARNLIELFFQRERAGKAATWVQVDKTKSSPVRRVAVLGAGVMGAGIAQLAALQGFDVVLKEINQELAQAGLKRVEALMNDAVKKGVVSKEEAQNRLSSITTTTEWAPLQNADLAIEAVVEREDVKRSVFRELGDRLTSTAILATNTSSLTVDRVTSTASHLERVGGLHFFNPVHKMQLVEVVRGHDTDSRTVGMLVEFVRKLGKVPVVVADCPGFLVNRILFPYLDESVRLLTEGYSVKAIDRAAVKFGMPMGPLELFDQVGLDIADDVAGSLIVKRPDSATPTPDKLASMVKLGWLGRKSGKGFYAYSDGRRGKPNHEDKLIASANRVPDRRDDQSETGLTYLQRRLIYPLVNESAHCLETSVADAAWVIDLAMVLGTGFAPFRGGPLRFVDSVGAGHVVQEMEQLGLRPCAMLKEMATENQKFYPAQPVAVGI